MKTLEERAQIMLDALKFYNPEIKHRNDVINKNAIVKLLKEQDKITRHACAENVGDEYIDCPECKNMEDEQYYCTTCGSQGGYGSAKASSIIMNTKAT